MVLPKSRCGAAAPGVSKRSGPHLYPCLHSLIGQRIIKASNHSVQRQSASTKSPVPGSLWAPPQLTLYWPEGSPWIGIGKSRRTRGDGESRYLDPCGRSGLSSSTRSGALHGCHANDPVTSKGPVCSASSGMSESVGKLILVRRS